VTSKRVHGLAGVRPLHTTGFREWLSENLDRVFLGMALATPQDDPSMLDLQYAEGMVLVLDEYFRRRSWLRTQIGVQRLLRSNEFLTSQAPVVEASLTLRP
jgi:hypothetical protein